MGSAKERKQRRAREEARRPASRRHAAREQLGELAGRARKQVLGRLDDQRGALVSAMEEAAHGIQRATRRSPDALSQRVLELGERALRGASSRLDEHSVESLVRSAERQVRQRPGLLVTGLLGAGVLAGRVFRASGASPSEGGAE
ncbi:hypothetical protein SAMN05443572_11083 [Myxococcus fulvus]|uniref:DUF883 domain-containing protein n=1 Tax=Myxococcus fulvus TaxID=33 RepID=A0A511T827_MYXFU|nr:hypothetical protein [Myxococcus fulvus]GEN10315.1 hypothetical protein MFU01_53520 [Myxococcus fulvus]SEU34579.1 hypothetical protein SAMN05443572_11083 [Myxococcus fulvus]